MAKTARALALALACIVVPACGSGGGGDPAPPTPSAEIALVVLSNNTLVTYAARAPGVPLYTLPVTGLGGGEDLVGIDYRPSTGGLYAVSDMSRLYTINPNTGAATPAGGSFTVPLSGTFFGMDFNPTTDRLRIVSNTGQNMRVNPDTGAVVDADAVTVGTQPDGNLVYALADVATGNPPDLVALAYTNNYSGATSTFALGIDRNLNSLVFLENPNAGTVGTINDTVGNLLKNVSEASFDIAPDNQAYLAGADEADTNKVHLYSVDLQDGPVTDRGLIGTGAPIQGITVAGLLPFNPLPGSIVALKGGKVLVNYSSSNPANILGVLTISGLTGELVGLDFRPATGELMALSDADMLYKIDQVTGAATVIGTGFAPGPAGTEFGVDFNPTADRLRVVSDADDNLRIDPTTGAVAAFDTDLIYAVGDSGEGIDPRVTASAYSNNVAGALTTTLYGLDIGRDRLVIQNPPNTGTLTTVGSLGVDAEAASFDINAAGTAYAALAVGGVTNLYTVNLATGAVTLVGKMGSGVPVTGITVKP